MQMAGGGKDTRGHEKGITRKEEADEKPGFDENDETNEESSAPADQTFDIVESVKELAKRFSQAKGFLCIADAGAKRAARSRAIRSRPIR
jgi:hypothetical protein